MLERLILKLALGFIIAVIGIAAIAVGIVLLGKGLENALTVPFGPIYGDLAAGGIILLPFLVAVIVLAVRLRREAIPVSRAVTHTIARSLFSAVARDAPWIAAAGAAVVAAGEVFLNRKKS